MQDGSVSDAYTFYTKAYSRKDNELTSPIYMMKAAFCLEIEGKFKEAIDLYEKVRLKYPASELSFKAETREKHFVRKSLELVSTIDQF